METLPHLTFLLRGGDADGEWAWGWDDTCVCGCGWVGVGVGVSVSVAERPIPGSRTLEVSRQPSSNDMVYLWGWGC